MRYIAILAVMLLAGCSWLSKKADPYICPEAGFVYHANRLPLADADARMYRVEAVCNFSKTDAVAVDLTVPFAVKKKADKPASKKVEAHYFIAVLKGDEIVQRQIFTTTLELGESGMGSNVEEHTVRIPGPPTEAYKYKIAVGFELTPEQLEQNKGKHP